MNIQVQASRSRLSSFSPGLSKPSSLHSKEKYPFHDDIMEKIGTALKGLRFLEEKEKMLPNNPVEEEDKENTRIGHSNLNDYMYPKRFVFPSVSHRSEEHHSLDMILSQDDISTVSSNISLATGEEWEEEVWDLRDYPSAVTDYRKYSWTIEVYDREHLAGDTVWFRASYNGKAGYREFEDTEILDFIAMAIELNPRFFFYVKAKFSESDDEPFSFFESDLILHALKSILRRAEHEDGTVIPSKAEILRKRALKHEKKEKKCFLAWLFRFPFGVSDREPQFGEL